MAKGYKTGGRKEGTPNKTTVKTRKLLKAFIDDELEKLPKYWDQIEEPKEKVKLLISILPYVLPKLLNEAAEINENGGINIKPIDWV